MYHALFTHQPTEGRLVCFQAQDNFHVCVLFLIPHPPQALLFTFYFQPASFFLFYIAAISLSGYAIQTSPPALAPTNIILGHDNNEIQEACVQNMESSSQNQFTGKCKGQSLDLGWGWFMKAWNSVDEQGLKDAPLLYPGEISSLRNSRLTNLLSIYPCCLCKIMSDDLELFFLVSASFSLTLLTRLSPTSN